MVATEARLALVASVVVAACSLQAQSPAASAPMQADVDRLVKAAAQLTDSWPRQPAPPLPEVADVARHGRVVTPLLMTLLSDDPSVERDRPRWKVQQQAALALAGIYDMNTAPCGSNYCDGDPPERIALIRSGWLRRIAEDSQIRALSIRELVDRFAKERLFFAQVPVCDELARRGDRSVIGELQSWLTVEDRHVRGNAALILGRLGDPRGFDTIVGILGDSSDRAIGQGIPGGMPNVAAQIRADRYYAAHLLGDLKDRRAVPVLVPLLDDRDVSNIVPWSLAEIGDARAVAPLIAQLERATASASQRVLAISALERLGAREALPNLRELVADARPASFGEQVTVAEAARHAIAVISGSR